MAARKNDLPQPKQRQVVLAPRGQRVSATFPSTSPDSRRA